MKTNFVKFQWLIILVIGLFMASCSENNDTTEDATADAYAEEVITRTQDGAKMGRGGCYELVFPISLAFPDSTVVVIDSYETLKASLVEWRKNNPKVSSKPSIAFPFSVINESGEIITVENETQQAELRAACGKPGPHNGGGHNGGGHNGGGHNGGQGKHCFEINFPYSVSLPDSTIVTLTTSADKALLHSAIKDFKAANPGVKVHPELVFPISVTLEDGTVTTVNSKDELKAIKDACN